MTYQNIYQLFREQTAKYRGKPVFYSRENDAWKSRNWEDFEEQVHDFACALLAKNLTRGASVAILAGNVSEWAIADIATIAAGGVGVGIYPTSSKEQCAFIINHSDAEFLVVDTQKQLEKVIDIDAPMPKLKQIICVEDTEEFSFEAVADEKKLFWKFNSVEVKEIPIIQYQDFLAFGKQNREGFLPKIEKIGFNAKPKDTAIMVYTSGTTGEPKGAMLSHEYILNSCESLRQTIPICDTDVCFSYLPFCHVAERISGLYNRLSSGTSVYFVNDLTKLYAYMLEVKPTVFASLPRFFEKIYAKVVSENGKAVDARKVKDDFGGDIRLATSGGAPLPNEIADFFARNDLPILQAYGLTENICVTFNRADDFKFGTVGKPMPMCEVKIADDGEILIKSSMMFSGYYKEPEKTAEMFDKNGWLKTGDLGSLDADGFLKIVGRKKEIIVLSSGKNVAPTLLENFLKENHLISQAFVCGDSKSYLVALVTLNQTEAEAFARASKIEFENYADLTRDERIFQSVKDTIELANARVSSSEQIKRFIILERDFQSESGEVTPTLKLKRNVVAKNFSKIIEKLYGEM
ncbi:MAG: long-chain fatty acid--CoA ligase [Acidobacteria bacterium]|jgi:long-chain acyl-CoA synthetase|nr:long-chain fatty acid--CoA ligase [Acidobacteriota bacterium]